MHKKTGPNLIHQTLTRLWLYNIYVQKPYKPSTIFLLFFKICYILEIFFTFYRPYQHTYTKNFKIFRKIKRTLYRLDEPGYYKLINFRINKQNKK